MQTRKRKVYDISSISYSNTTPLSHRILKCFRSIETKLFLLRKDVERNILNDVCVSWRSFETDSSEEKFILDDFLVIYSLRPDFYSIIWKNKENVFSIRLNTEGAVKITHEWMKIRDDSFCARLDEMADVINDGLMKVLPLPINPYLRSETAAQTMPISIQQVNALSVPTHSSSKLMVQNASTSIAELRLLAEERGRTREDEIAAMRLSKERDLESLRLKSLPSICDVLRSVVVTNNRVSWLKKDLLSRVAPSCGLSSSELFLRIEMLSRIVPEFMSVVPPDSVIRAATIRFNIHVRYASIRSKIALSVLEK